MEFICIAKIKKYIEDHFTEDICLDDIAKVSGYSKYHMNRLFFESTGQTIHNYIRERRLYEATELLTNTDKAIVEIALIVGYTSQQSFTRAFGQMFGITPQIYRNSNVICTYTSYLNQNMNPNGSSNHRSYGFEVMSA
ncbi:MAG: helix-turn-helix domain-containing protein [Lachnotalea sp.]